MAISDLLGDNLIACTALDVALVPGLNTPATRGPIQSAANLYDIAEHVKVTNLKPAKTSDTSHARPTMLASISSFAENVKAAWAALPPGAAPNQFLALPQAVQDDFAEWQGMIAAVALSNIFSAMGLNLSVSVMNISETENSAMCCVIMEMEKDRYYRRAVAGGQGKLFYICQNGIPFAVFHPEVGLCPMKQYDSSIFEGVLPWFERDTQNCHAGWKDICQKLDAYSLSRVAAWAKGNNMMIYENYLQHKCGPLQVLPNALAKIGSVANAERIDEVWLPRGTAFGTAMMAYLDNAGQAQPMPNLFLDELMISSIGGKQNNRMIYNVQGGVKPVCFQNGVLDDHVPVPPFKKNVMDILSGCILQDLSFTAELSGEKGIKNVVVDVTFDTPTGVLKMQKIYDSGHIRQGSMPYLMLWPCIPMPAETNLWRSFYATWTHQVQGMTPIQAEDGSNIPFVSGNLSYTWGNQGVVHDVYRPTASNQDWPVCVGTAPFRYAVLTQVDDKTGSAKELGLIFMPHQETAPVRKLVTPAAPVKLAVDFGTTSTVCALSSSLFEGDAKITLPFMDYSRCVTCDDSAARANVANNSWLGCTDGTRDWKWNQKLFSIAQLFEQNPGVINRQVQADTSKQEYYVDGRLFLASGNVLTNLAGNCAGVADPLLAQQIMNDMKFNHTLNVMNYQAASLFLAGVYIYAVLYLLKEGLIPAPGADLVELRVSYPNNVTLDALKQNWGFTQTILSKVMAPELLTPISTLLASPNRFYNEATAATAYQHRPGAGVSFTNDLVSLDIGGGTSDISISNPGLHPDDVRNLSIRYAGREIMVSSLVELYRKINPATPALVNESAFANLWGENSETVSLTNLFEKLCKSDNGGGIPFLHNLTKNSTLRMDVEMLLSKGIRMGNASNLNPTNLLRQLITMKFLMLLRIVAKMVRKNLDMWEDPKTGKRVLVGNALEINLSISGTGAQLLQYVFDCSMGELVKLQVPAALDMNSPMAQCLNMMNTVFYEELKDSLGENEYTQLKIFVDPDVAKKLDVCYGMLEPSIDHLVPATAAHGAFVPGFQAQTSGFPAAATTPIGMSVNERNQRHADMQQKINTYQLNSEQASLERYLDDTTDRNGNVVHGMMAYWKWYENIYFAAPQVTNRGLGPNVSTMSKLLSGDGYKSYFTSARTEVANERSAFMIEPEQEAYYEDLLGMYMVEELLDWMIAQNQ